MRARTVTTTLGVAVIAALVGGCGGADGEAGDQPSSAVEGAAVGSAEADATSPSSTGGANGSATLSVAGREFSFDLAVCGVHDGEVVVGGPGTETGAGGPAYLDGDTVMLDGAVYGEFRVEIGTDQPFDSTDDFIALGNSAGGDLSLTDDGADHRAVGSAWAADGGSLGEGTLLFSCG